MTTIVLTVRLIKSFEFRTERNLVMRVDPSITGRQLMDLAQAEIKRKNLRAYLVNDFDTLKIYTRPHGSKTNNLIINMGNDAETAVDLDKPLHAQGIENEWELSMFNLAAYHKYMEKPETKW
eukprot:Partr_v1_DN21853_c0_g1_i1_m70133 putative chromosome 2 open reading frame 76